MRCKPGDRAEIIGGVFEENAVNVGKIVEVCQLDGFHPEYGPIWLVRSSKNDLVTEFGGVGDNLHCADTWLKPLPPEALTPKTVTKEIENV